MFRAAGTVRVDGVRHPADRDVLDVGSLASEDRHEVVRLALVLEGLQVVSDRQEVDLGRELHRRMAPVAVGEDPELATRHQAFHLVLDGSHLFGGVASPGGEALRDLRGHGRIGLRDGGDIDPVQRGELVEVDDVIVKRVSDEDQVPDVLRVHRNLEIEGVLNRAHGREGMHGGADSAEPLGEEPCLARIAAEQDLFDSSEHGGRSPGLVDPASIDLDVDPEMPFDSSDGVDRDSVRHARS
jgi:hypothetical protein